MSLVSPLDQELLNRLNRHPNLKERLEALLSIAEDTKDELVKADEVERHVILEIRQMGHEVLTGWAQSRVEKSASYLPKGESSVVRSGKKNSIGIVALVKSKCSSQFTD